MMINAFDYCSVAAVTVTDKRNIWTLYLTQDFKQIKRLVRL